MSEQCIQFSDTAPISVVLTVFDEPGATVPTIHGPIRFDEWLARERDRRTDGLLCGIVQDRATGRIALASLTRHR